MLRKISNTLLLTFTACLLLTGSTYAKDGYKIQLKFTDTRDTLVYLAHYFGKPLPTIYKSDSAKIDKNGVAVLQSKEKLLGGIYIILLSDKKTYFDFLLDNGADMSITVTTKNLPAGLVFKNSQENLEFMEYGKFLATFGATQQKLNEKLAAQKTKSDSTLVYEEIRTSGKDLVKFRKDFIEKHKGSLLSSIFSALSLPVVPDEKHYLEDGVTVDSLFPFRYYKSHYWDDFNFNDDRLINTPLFDSRLDEYINKLCFQHEDSIIKESNTLLSKMEKSPELYKYTLWWLTYNAENSKIMGMDAVFVYLVENYYMKGKASWLKPEELEKFYAAARKIAPNVLGNMAPEINLPDVNGVEQSLLGQKNKYTLLIFWSPDCGHCKHEIPIIDSLYKAELKKKGVRIYAVSTYDDDEKVWKDFIKNNNLQDWTHVWNPKHTSRFREQYNVYMTPILYLLDEKKIIRGKRIDYTNIAGLVDYLDKKQKQNSTK